MDKRKTRFTAAGFIISASAIVAPSITSAEPGSTSIQNGKASWYGPGFSGRRTANGETFDPNAMTAAHRTLPFGTHVRVVNMHTGQSVVVRINDRGPYAQGRIIDLSRASAQALGISGVGTVAVTQL